MAKVPEHSEIQNVFAMNEPLHMVAKLMWELENLTKSMSVWTDNKGYPVPIFAAFNTAITAWHITDWLWQSNPQTRAVLARRYDFTFNEWKPKDLRAALGRFQNAVARDSRALHICREIANGSKHMRTDKADPNVKAVAKWDPVVEGVGLVKPGDLVMSLTILDGEQTHDAARLFIQAFGYWEYLFTKEKLTIGKTRLPDKFIKSS